MINNICSIKGLVIKFIIIDLRQRLKTTGETQAQVGGYQDGSPGGGMWVYGLDWAGPGQRQVADACECGNEPSGSVK